MGGGRQGSQARVRKERVRQVVLHLTIDIYPLVSDISAVTDAAYQNETKAKRIPSDAHVKVYPVKVQKVRSIWDVLEADWLFVILLYKDKERYFIYR